MIARLATALLLAPLPALAAPVTLDLLGSFEIAPGTEVQGTTFGGISGLDRRADGGYVALSDDRGGSGGTPRFYDLQIEISEAGIGDVAITGVTELRRPDGTPFPADAPTVDPEGVRVAPNGNLYVSSEGNFSDDPGALFQPFVREFTEAGEFVRELSVPEVYDYDDGETDGARDNRLLEALAVTPDGTVYTGNEGALIPDGEGSTAAEGSPVRITATDPVTGEPVAQHAYELGPVPLGGTAGAPGLTEILALGRVADAPGLAGREGFEKDAPPAFLALERSFSGDVGNTVAITYTEILPETTDILGLDALEEAKVVPMSREVLLLLTEGFEGIDNDNLEAMAFGPLLENGNPTLIVAADDNFNAFGNQRTLFLAFEVAPIPAPGALPLLAAALGGLVLLRRSVRRS
jgi:hypothetical protein